MDSWSWFWLGYILGSDDEDDNNDEEEDYEPLEGKYLEDYEERIRQSNKRIKRWFILGIIAFLIFIIVLICVCLLVPA